MEHPPLAEYTVTFYHESEDEGFERFAKYYAESIGHAFEQAAQDVEDDERITEVQELGI